MSHWHYILFIFLQTTPQDLYSAVDFINSSANEVFLVSVEAANKEIQQMARTSFNQKKRKQLNAPGELNLFTDVS